MQNSKMQRSWSFATHTRKKQCHHTIPTAGWESTKGATLKKQKKKENKENSTLCMFPSLTRSTYTTLRCQHSVCAPHIIFFVKDSFVATKHVSSTTHGLNARFLHNTQPSSLLHTHCTDNLQLKKRTQAVVVVVVLTNGGRGCRLESTELPA